MKDATLRTFLDDLEKRRKRLGMTWEALAERSGLSRATVCRILSGRTPAASFSHVLALAAALGVEVEFKQKNTEKMAEEQAKHQAKRLVGMVQGTMGLEAQAVNGKSVDRMYRDTYRRLMAGSRRKLWFD
jgi:transcriptional regulator with XRE-family HTH domain